MTRSSQIAVVDYGNTRKKLAFFNEKGEIIRSYHFKKDEAISTDVFDSNQRYRIAISSVTTFHDQETDLWERLDIESLIFLRNDDQIKLPLKVKYKSPDKLGQDRLAALCGAYSLYPSTSCLVVDMGTCNTYDYLTATGDYFGGAISPGVDLKFSSLNNYTSALPLIKGSAEFDFEGVDTQTSIMAGVMQGTLEEVKGFIKYYDSKYGLDRIILCGGASAYFKSKIEGPIVVIPDLVLLGLHAISKLNE
ncbi:MAG: type III pantothenate kinase [Cyclobacteriaceae bacterium]|nr:type III pantothenate kinase [Cyclobacteriaceae bacterium]MCH8515490.1 type III pantothenate kinase [Cyclobacteriaceae bacterium]